MLLITTGKHWKFGPKLRILVFTMKFGFYFEFQIVICWTFFPNRTDLFLMHYSFIVLSDNLSLAPTNYSTRLKLLIASYLSSVQFMFTLCVSLKTCPAVEHRSPVTTLIDVPDILYYVTLQMCLATR